VPWVRCRVVRVTRLRLQGANSCSCKCQVLRGKGAPLTLVEPAAASRPAASLGLSSSSIHTCGTRPASAAAYHRVCPLSGLRGCLDSSISKSFHPPVEHAQHGQLCGHQQNGGGPRLLAATASGGGGARQERGVSSFPLRQQRHESGWRGLGWACLVSFVQGHINGRQLAACPPSSAATSHCTTLRHMATDLANTRAVNVEKRPRLQTCSGAKGWAS
jgi:hypothetical protein